MSDLTTRQAAERLGVTVPTVISWIKSGRLDGRQGMRGRRIVWRCSELSVEAIRHSSEGDRPEFEQRIAALESQIAPLNRGVVEALQAWIAAEDAAARRRRRVIELLARSQSPQSSGPQDQKLMAGDRSGRRTAHL